MELNVGDRMADVDFNEVTRDGKRRIGIDWQQMNVTSFRGCGTSPQALEQLAEQMRQAAAAAAAGAAAAGGGDGAGEGQGGDLMDALDEALG
jgi:hypothetical protein